MSADNVVLQFLQGRNSAPKLIEPGPSADELEQMLQCAMRAPDHARVRPWRFISVQGARREALGELLLASLLRRQPEADEAARHKALNAPLRAPLVLAVIATYTEHPKVPAWEQQLSAGCAAFNLSLAAEALGYAAIWRTGPYAEDKQLLAALGGDSDDHIVGFIYVGTRDGQAKALPELDSSEFHQAF